MSISVPGLDSGSYDVRIRNPDGDVATLRSGIVISRAAPLVPENCRNVTIPFDLDASSLNADARQTLRSSGECFSLQGVRVRVEGHCDERGTTEYNLALGQRRADAVQRYLVSQGIAASRISTVSYGEEQPLSRGGGERAWSQNRRAEIKISE